MKRLLLLFPAIIISTISMAQNVGIGTTTPQATLDVKGNVRTGGTSNFILYDTLSGKISWTNSNLFVTTPQYLMKHSASSEGLYSNSSQLEYRNSTGNPIFYTNWSNGNGFFSGNLGIGLTNPTAKLQIKDGASGITPFFSARMVVETNSHTYINLLSPDPFETGILFGSGTQAVSGLISYNSTTVPKGFIFNNNGNQTRMVIDNTGNVGIGTTTPTSSLNVNGQLTIDQKNFGGYGGLLLKGNVPGSNYPNIAFTIKNNAATPADVVAAMIQGDLINNTAGAERIDLTFLTSATGLGGLSEKLRIKSNGNVGIGTNNPNAPLAFPALLGKKITLYPGNTGDVGFAVAGNRLQIYADNPAADVAIGYDASGTFNERFAFKPNGALAINGSTGTAGQLLQSNGSGAAAGWIDPASLKTQYYQVTIPAVTLTNVSPSFNINVPVTVYANSIITVSISTNISTASYFGCTNGELSITTATLGGGGLVTSVGRFLTQCGVNHNSVASGELPLLTGTGAPQVFGSGTGFGAIISFFKNNSGPDLTIGDLSPARIIVKVVPL